MISRRHFVQAAMATTALYGASGFGNWSRLAAQQVLSQDDLIGSSDFGNVSLIHITDIHAQTAADLFPRAGVQHRRRPGRRAAAAPVGADFRAPTGSSRAARWITR
jgi:sulfur-oxidizing protein SoxB